MPRADLRIVADWRRASIAGGTAVVIDVIRFSTTLCALLSAGRRPVYVVEGPKSLRWVPGLRDCDVYSELRFESPGRRFDNSPSLAHRPAGGRAAAICTTTGTRAVFASAGARRVLIGSFANFSAVLAALRAERGPLWFVPAAGPDHNPIGLEDIACAKAFRDALSGRASAPRPRLADIAASPRVPQFLDYRPGTGVADLAYSLGLDSLPVVPEMRFLGPRLARAEML